MKNISECKKKPVFEFDYTADFLFVFCHIEYEKEGWIGKENNQMSTIQITRDIDFKNRCKKFNTTAFAFGNLSVILGNRTTHTSCSNKSTKTDLDVLKHGKEKKG